MARLSKLKLPRLKLADMVTWELVEAMIPSLLLIGLALFVAYKFIDPAPPRRLVISTGSPELNYKAFASIYAVYMQREGITLEVRDSSGDLENLKRLQDPQSGVDIAFIQDGVASTQGAGTLLSLGSLYYNPMWVFCRCKAEVTHLAKLKGKRIAIGKPGEGAHLLASQLLEASGVNQGNSRLVPIGGLQAAEALLAKRVDAAILVDVPDSPLINSILADRSVRLVSLDDAEALTRRFPHLHHLRLPEGALDLARNLPPRHIDLVAPAAALVVREDMHPALVYLMLKIISQVHGGPGMLHQKGDFPSAKDTDFPLSAQAANFYESGMPFIDKYLPFWAATFVNRVLIVIVPLLVVLIPLTRIVPMVYVWLVKRKLFRFYGELRFIDAQLKEGGAGLSNEEYLKILNDIENGVRELKLPVAFSQHAYELRAHIDLVRSRLEKNGPDSALERPGGQ